MVKRLKMAWAESADELEARYKEVLRRVRGHGSSGAHNAYLTPLQQRALFAKAQLGEFRTV